EGFVVGEGVGAVLLKPLSAAERDGDYIYGVLKGSSINTGGYMSPDPKAQSEVVQNALIRSGVPGDTISYVEAHGTGTNLGDPIELRGLEKAFTGLGSGPIRCALGSVKGNIGHLESAAGISALTKVLLQLREGELVPSLHSTPSSSHIDWSKSRFYMQQTHSPWTRGSHPRRAGVSSFGAGGSNAHLIVEEYE
ncbi:ketoacyl-synthetase C-terminal extension domain-containing protein, partial [Fulvivirga kasyanovii]